MIIRFPPGMRADASSEFTLQGLMSNANAYAEEWVGVDSTPTSVFLGTDAITLTTNQVMAKNVILLAGAVNSPFIVFLPPTSKILDALGPTVSRDGSFWFDFYIANQLTGRDAVLAPGDTDTTVDSNNNFILNGHFNKWMVNVVPQSDPALPLQLNFHSVFSATTGGASNLTVTDGVTSVPNVTTIDLTSGATVSNAGGGTADVAIITDQPTVDLTGNVATEISLGQHVFYRFLSGDMVLTAPTWAAAAPTNATPFEGYTILFIFEQDVTGAHNVTPPSNFAFPDGFPAAIAPGSKAFTVWTGVYYGSIGAGTTPLNGWLCAVATQFAAR